MPQALPDGQKILFALGPRICFNAHTERDSGAVWGNPDRTNRRSGMIKGSHNGSSLGERKWLALAGPFPLYGACLAPAPSPANIAALRKGLTPCSSFSPWRRRSCKGAALAIEARLSASTPAIRAAISGRRARL